MKAIVQKATFVLSIAEKGDAVKAVSEAQFVTTATQHTVCVTFAI